MRSPIALLREHGLAPKKSLGQNFLTDRSAAERIAIAATDPPGGTVLEIGPGLGALTTTLVERAGRVIALEQDRELVAVLSKELEPQLTSGRLVLHHGDAFDRDWLVDLDPATNPHPITIAGNLPYSQTGRFLERTVHLAASIDKAVFMIQLEVAARVAAAPGSKIYGALSVFVQAAFRPERLLVAKAGAFHPRPDVDSAVIVLHPRSDDRLDETPAFRELVRAAFGMRRKTLRNAWRNLSLPFDAVRAAAAAENIELERRGETLSPAEFAAVARRL